MDRRFRVLLVRGPYPLIRGFIAGLLTGKDLVGKVFYCEKEKIDVDLGDDEGIAEKFAEWVGFHRYLSTAIAIEESVHGAVIEGIKSDKHGLNLTVGSSRAVAAARFHVHFETFSEDAGGEIRELLDIPPSGVVRSDDFQMKETRHKDAAGIEAYAPDHEYQLNGEGDYVGPLDKIVELRRRASVNELIHCGSIQLDYE